MDIGKTLFWIVRFVPPVALVGCIAYIIILIKNKSNWKTKGDDKIKREQNRGTLVSIGMSIVVAILGITMASVGVKEDYIITNLGFIFTPVFGYMLDQIIGLDEGWAYLKNGEYLTALKYFLSSLVSNNFLRYIVTVFLDLFISSPLQEILKIQVKELGTIDMLLKSNSYDRLLGRNFPNILQSLVAVITFQAYTNQTRFSWAYASKDTEKKNKISPGTIMLSTTIAGVIYLIFYKTIDLADKSIHYKGFDNIKLVYVLATIIILFLLNNFNIMETPECVTEKELKKKECKVLSEKEKIKQLNRKAVVGGAIFTGFLYYGVIMPFLSVF